MTPYEIVRRLPESATALVARTRNAIRTHEVGVEPATGRLDGDDTKGAFSVPTSMGDVCGRYVIRGAHIQIEITATPILVTEAMVTRNIDEFLSVAGS